MLRFLGKLLKKQRTTASKPNTTTTTSSNDPILATKMKILDEVEQILSKRYHFCSRVNNIICVSADPNLYPVVMINLFSENYPALQFVSVIAENITQEDEVFDALVQLNANEYKYRYIWSNNCVMIDYIMDCITDQELFEKEILGNVYKLGLAALCAEPMFSPIEIKRLERSNICRFNEPSDDELFKEQVAAVLDKYNLKYQWFEHSKLCYRKHFLIEPTSGMQADDISVYVRPIDSNEYGVTIETTVPIGEVELNMLDLSYTVNAIAVNLTPRYKLLRDWNDVIMSYTVSLDCFDRGQLLKMCTDISLAKDYAYAHLNALTRQAQK